MKKICYTCKLEKEIIEFRKKRLNKDGYANSCKECLKDKYKNKYQKVRKLHYQNNIQKERESALKYYNKHREQQILSNKKYKEKHYDILINKKRQYRDQIEFGVINNYSFEDYLFTFKIFNNKCYRCGSSDRRLCIDHHYPISLGFGLSRNNAVLLCNNCNLSKSNKLPKDFYYFGELNVLYSIGIMDLNDEISNIENYKNDYY